MVFDFLAFIDFVVEKIKRKMNNIILHDNCYLEHYLVYYPEWIFRYFQDYCS